jgi:hypothetical protein
MPKDLCILCHRNQFDSHGKALEKVNELIRKLNESTIPRKTEERDRLSSAIEVCLPSTKNLVSYSGRNDLGAINISCETK